MSLAGLGRQAVASVATDDAAMARLSAASDLTEEQKRAAREELEKARKDIVGGLTPWIPGDFVVTYGVLLTAWSTVQASWGWLLLISAAAAVVYVTLGAFAATGFRQAKGSGGAVAKKLFWRTVVGFGVSLAAAIAIPRSGWYDFAWFRDHEQSVVITASLLVVVPIMVLTGLERRGITLREET